MRDVAVIGGGRWARVITDILCAELPPERAIAVYTRGCATVMREWTGALEARRRVTVIDAALPSGAAAAIVANAARDHETAAAALLANRIPVLIEKPAALSANGVERLIGLAGQHGVFAAVSNPFLFAGYLQRFAALLRQSVVTGIRVRWIDPGGEVRYGERKRHDPTLPVYADCLPHVCAMLELLLPGRMQRLAAIEAGADGQRAAIALDTAGVPCHVNLERDGRARVRMIEADTADRTLRLDFSQEPGTIDDGTTSTSADAGWTLRPRPMTQLLRAFLSGSAGETADPRLSLSHALRAARIIDAARERIEHRR